MVNRESRDKIRNEIEPNLDEIKTELKNIFDPENIEEVVRISRELSSLSSDDLLKPFTI
ncbi:MAG: hypothetical protein KAI50_15320 [Desulfobacterales bacterium]|nr:hypothetical protein [Desulfobacterales bacterium]